MEMNTRIQVEHTVTEEVTGIDPVREQVLIGTSRSRCGRRTSSSAATRSSAGSTPRTSRAGSCPRPAGSPPTASLRAGVRVDSGVVAGSEISGLYDPMIVKLIVHGGDREHARLRMLRALDEFEIGGLPTLLGFHRALLSTPSSRRHRPRRRRVRGARRARGGADPEPRPRRRSNGRLRPASTAVEVGGRRYDVTVLEPEPPWLELARRRRERGVRARAGAGGDSVVSPMQGTVLKVDVADGDEVEAGKVICVVEAMKMENEIAAHRRAPSRTSRSPRATRSRAGR